MEDKALPMNKIFKYTILQCVTLICSLLMAGFLGDDLYAQTPKTYYIDCLNGSDTNSGLSESLAWKTLANPNKSDYSPGQSKAIQPGDKILLRRGRSCTYQNTGTGNTNASLHARWTGTAANPITIGAYGTGDIPIVENSPTQVTDTDRQHDVFRITGQYQVFENLYARVVNPPVDSQCEVARGLPASTPDQPVGWYWGFDFELGAHYNTVRNSKATHLTAGIHFQGNAQDDLATLLDRIPSHNKILNNIVTDNHAMGTLTPFETPACGDPTDPNSSCGKYDDIGAWGMNVHGYDNEIGYNYIANNSSYCVYESQGSTGASASQGNSIELFIAKDSYIHHNIALHTKTFSEIGGCRDCGISVGDIDKFNTENITFAYNVFVSTIPYTRFLVIHGLNTDTNRFGPTRGIKAHNNSVYIDAPYSSAVVCVQGCSRVGGPIDEALDLRNNIIWVKDYNGGSGQQEKAIFTTDYVGTQYENIYSGRFLESHNLYWNGGGAVDWYFFQNLPPDATSRVADPLFKNPAQDDLHLNSSASPAINAGTYLGYTSDLDGNPVVSGSVDIGAYEYVSTTPTPTSHSTPTPTRIRRSGDVDGDGDVDIFDYNVLLANFGRTGISGGASVGDFEPDGDVDIFDYNMLLSNFGT